MHISTLNNTLRKKKLTGIILILLLFQGVVFSVIIFDQPIDVLLISFWSIWELRPLVYQQAYHSIILKPSTRSLFLHVPYLVLGFEEHGNSLRLISPKSGQLGPINHCSLEESWWKNELCLSTQDWLLSPCVNRFQNTWMNGRSYLPYDPKLSSVYVLAHSGVVIRCCPMADSQLILDLLFLYIRGGCFLTVLLFSLMLWEHVVLFCLLASA